MKRPSSPIALSLAALCLVFSVAAAVCQFEHAGTPDPRSHHHPTGPSHATLCVWACQADPTAAALASLPSMPSLGLAVSFPPTVHVLASTISRIFIPSRAPPR